MARVLVIEDEYVLRKRISSILSTNGYEVIEAESGKEGIECLLKKSRPELILLDMVMPSINGMGFLDFQRNSANFSQIPVVIISAFQDLAKDANANGFLAKPIESADLLKTVAKYCQ